MSEQEQQNKKDIVKGIIDDLDACFDDTNLSASEVLAILGGKVADILLRGNLNGFLWMSFMGSMTHTLMVNIEETTSNTKVFNGDWEELSNPQISDIQKKK